MDKIRQEHNQFLQNLVTSFHREIQQEIGWDERLLFIKGARGVGKTTLILQYIKQTYDFDTKALYVSMDSLNTANYTLLDIAKQHSNLGGTHLFIDEIHKYDRWSIELKNIYDLYQNLHVVVSGSSILDLYKGNADLSRRAITHVLQGLSLREFLNIQNDLVLQRYTLAEIIKDHVKIVHEILKVTNPLQYFKDYLAYGYYPFYLQGVKYFHQKLNNTINQIIEVDIPTLFNLEVSNISKIKKLLYHIATIHEDWMMGGLQGNRRIWNQIKAGTIHWLSEEGDIAWLLVPGDGKTNVVVDKNKMTILKADQNLTSFELCIYAKHIHADRFSRGIWSLPGMQLKIKTGLPLPRVVEVPTQMLQSEYALSEQFPYLIKLVFEVPPIWKSDKAMLQIRPKKTKL